MKESTKKTKRLADVWDLKKPADMLIEYQTAEVETHESWGRYIWQVTLCEYFGRYFIFRSSPSRVEKIDLTVQRYADAKEHFADYVKLHRGTMFEESE